jgi:hypothetical protein
MKHLAEHKESEKKIKIVGTSGGGGWQATSGEHPYFW